MDLPTLTTPAKQTSSRSTRSPDFSLAKASRLWGDRFAIKDFTLNIPSGQTVALIGPSGGGKSTLIRLLAGALKASSGHVYVNDQDLGQFTSEELRFHRSRCRIVEQTHLLVPQMTVHQNVVAGLLSGWPWFKITASALWPIEQSLVRKVLDSLGIGEHQWKLASELSGGQMQRVAIARALISEPWAILADEPTASLDPATARAVTELILSQAKSRNITLVFCTHWLDIVMSHCDRVIGLREGRLALDAEPSEITQEALDYLYEGSAERI
jgi:phosphonate transport system ATP-binding protein